MQQLSPAAAKDVFEKAVGFTKADEFRRAGLYPYFTEFSAGADSGEASPLTPKLKLPQSTLSISMVLVVRARECSTARWIFT